MVRRMLDARPLVAPIVATGVGVWGLSAYPLPRDNVFLPLIALRNPPVPPDRVASDSLALHEAPGRSAALTHWSFEQLATLAGAPPKYLRTLPAMIASSAINHRLQRQRLEQQ